MSDLSVVEDVDQFQRDYWLVRPDPMSHTAFARTLTVPDSEDEHGRQDPYDPKSHPGQWHVVQALDGIVNNEPAPRRYRRFLLITDAQGGGKSWLLQQVIFHGLIELGNDVLWALPTKGMAGDLWNLKLRPAWEGAGLGVYLPTSGSGSRGSSSPRSVRTRRIDGRGGGTLVFMSSGGRGQSGQAGLTAKRLAVDELSDWDKAAYTRIRKRVSRWNEIAVEIYGSTLKLDQSDLTLAIYEEGTRARVEYRCVHCKGWTPFQWKTWVGGEAPHVSCIACTAIINGADRLKMMAEHRLSQEDPNRDIFSIMLTALDCPWKSFAWLAAGEESAARAEKRGDFEPMRTFHHDERVQIYEEPQPEGELSTKLLADRSSTSNITKRIVPAWVKFLTIAQDPGKGVHYWQVMGHGDGDRWAMIDWGYERTVEWVDGKMKREPNDEDHVHVLNLIRDKANEGWQVEGTDRKMRPVQRGIDIGYKMKLIVAWLAGEPEWKAVRGLGESNYDESKSLRPDGERGKFALAEEISRTNSLIAFRPAGWRQYIYGLVGDAIRHNIHASLLRTPDDHGSGQIPKGLKANDMLILHLCGEVWKPSEIKDGKQIAGYWAHPHGGWDLLDCGRYNIAMSMLHRFHPERYDSGELISEPLPDEPTPEENWIRNTTTTTWKI